MTEFPSEALELAATVERMLAEYGPLTEEQIAERLRSAGTLPGWHDSFSLSEVLGQVVNGVMPLTDGRWVSLPDVLRGRIFTHRVSAEELAHDVLRNDGDLTPLTALMENEPYQRLADGTQVREVVLPFDVELLVERSAPIDAFGEAALMLEPGRLAALGLRPDDLLALSLTTDGIELSAVHEDVAPAAGLEAVLVELMPPDAEPDLYDTVVWSALTDHPELLTAPAAPLEMTIRELGYAKDDDWLAPPGFDFGAWRAAQRLERVMERYDLDVDEATAVIAVVALYERVAELYEAAAEADRSGDLHKVSAVLDDLSRASSAIDAPVPGTGKKTVRDALVLLDEPAVASALLAETELAGPTGARSLGLFAETLEELAPRAARPALRWLRAKAYERIGAIAEAEQALAAAEDLDASWPLTLYDLARYASDHGDAERGLSLLRRAGAPPGEPLVEVLERFRAKPRTDIGRNDRCWCGSGRKYKQCHLHRERLPLANRAAWLYQKAAMCVGEGRGHYLLIDLADERSRYNPADDAILDALDDPVVTDMALFEGGIFLDFLAARGVLLPEDERSLAEQWLLVERSVHEVIDVRPGQELRVRDVRSGAVHDVRERAASGDLEPGELFCARIVPAGDTTQIVGGSVRIAAHRRDEVLALLDAKPDPRDLLAALTRMELIDNGLSQPS